MKNQDKKSQNYIDLITIEWKKSFLLMEKSQQEKELFHLIVNYIDIKQAFDDGIISYYTKKKAYSVIKFADNYLYSKYGPKNG